MKIGIIGAGAVGGYYGALLAKSGFEVHFLLNNDYAHVKENGLIIDSKDGNFSIDSVNAHAAFSEMPVCDLVIIALKATHNYLLNETLPDLVAENGIIVTLQNGYGIEADLHKLVPSATIIGGLCFLCSCKVGPGHIQHLDHGSIRLGQYFNDDFPAGISEELRKAAEIFSLASIPVKMTEDLGKARWEKLVWNMGFNGTTVILNATTNQIMKNQSACSLVKAVMLEAIRGARACGFDIKDDFAEVSLAATEKMIDYRPSMKLDYEAGRPLEIEHIYWRPVREAEKYGYEMRRSQILGYQLDFLDQININKRNKKITKLLTNPE